MRFGPDLSEYYGPERSADAADWITSSCYGPLFSFHRYVPPGFPHYLRICNPGWIKVESSNGHWDPITWSAVSEKFGFHGDTNPRWRAPKFGTQGNDFLRPPEEDVMQFEAVEAVFDTLLRASGPLTPCVCALWEGFASEEVREFLSAGSARIEGVGQQSHILLRAPLEKISENWKLVSSSGLYSSCLPQMVWPTSKEWFFHNPFDMCEAFLGGDEELIQMVHAYSDVETYVTNESLYPRGPLHQ